MGPLGYVLKHYEPARFLWGFLVFLPCVFCAILFGMLGQLALSIRCWHAFCFGNGVTNRVHGALPPAGEPAIWVANHFNWFDWPLLQALLPYTLHAIVKARLGPPVWGLWVLLLARPGGGGWRLTVAVGCVAGGHWRRGGGGAHHGPALQALGRNLPLPRRPRQRHGAAAGRWLGGLR